MKFKLIAPLLFLFSFLFTNVTVSAAGKPPCLITGPTQVCTNQSASYQVDVNNPAYTYQWVITGGTLLSQTGNTSAVQWNVSGAGSISVNVTQNGTLLYNCTLAVNVFNTPAPNIVPSFEATCFEDEDPGGENVASVGRPKEDPCSKVCENSTVVYRVSNHAGSTYTWQINGLSYTSTSGQGTNIFTVNWGTVSTGTIQVTETNAAGCSKTVYKCIQIIRAPVANFSTTPPHNGSFVTICRDQTVTFKDLSVATGNSPIVSWVWNFGDGTGTATYSAGATVTHQYTNDNGGNPFIATLTVKNACGCENTFAIKIIVSKFDVPELICPSTVCCNKSTKYTIRHADDEHPGCGYMWSVSGGTLLSPLPGQVADEATIIWDCSATPKTITLIPVNCNGCDNPIVYDITVITSAANINGKAIVCANSEEVYSIPAMPGCNFTWTLSDPSAGDVFAGAQTNSIKVRWHGNLGTTVILSVHYVNTVFGCEGTGQLAITLRPELVINASGNSVCAGNPITFSSVDEFGGIVNVAWQINQLPSGANVLNNPGPINIITHVFATGGDFEIVATDNAGSTCNSPVKLIRTITGIPPVHTGTVNGQFSNICPGQSYMYTTTATSSDYTLVWAVSPPGSGTVTPTSGNKVNIVWTAAGQIQIYQVSKTNPACTSAVRTINVTMVPPPSCNIGGVFNACPNSTFTYTAAGGYSNYAWSINPSSAGSIITGQGTSSIGVQWHNTNTAITATLSVAIRYCGSNTQNCTSSFITISPAPAIAITPANSSVCQSDAQTYTVTGITSASTVTWNWGDGSTNTVGPSLFASHAYGVAGTYNITVLVQQPNNCFGSTSTASTNVTVNSRPAVAISIGGTGNTVLCPNDPPGTQPATLIATILSGGCGASGVFQWLKNGSIITGATGSSYSPSWPATLGGVDVYTFQYSCAGIPCSVVTSTGVTLRRPVTCDVCALAGIPNPTLTWNQTPLTACGSGSLVYTAPSPGFAVRLDFDDLTTPVVMPPANPNSGTVAHTYARAGIYHPVLYTKYPSTTPGVYCDYNISQEVVVPVIANAIVSVVCNPAGGYNIVVTDISDRLTSYNTIIVRQCKLDGGAPQNMPTGTFTFTGIAAGNHTITFTIGVSDGVNSYTCSVTNPAILPVLNTPAINIVQGSPRCIGAPVQFTTNATNVAAYLWQFGDATSSLLPDPTHQYNAAFSPVTVNLQITTNEGCVASNSTTLNILPNNLTATITSPSGSSPLSICQGSTSPVLNAVVTGANGATSYVWNTSTLNNISTNSSIVASNQVSDRYAVTVRDAIGCIKIASPFEVIVKPAPVAAIIGKDEYCYGEVVTLSAQQGNGYTYQWTVNGSNYGTSSAISFYGNIGNNTVTLTVSSNGCSSSTTITVRINTNPYVYVSPGFNSQLCAGQPNVLTANVYNGTPPYSYYWNTTPVQTTPDITVSNAGLYQATVIDINGCKASGSTRVYRVEDFTNFMSGCYEICNDKKVLLVGPKSPSIANLPLPPDNVPYEIIYAYQWYKDGVPIPAPDGTNADYTVDPNPGPYSGSGQYTLSVTSMLPSAGCENNSLTNYEKSFTVNFVECTKCKVDMRITNIYCLNGERDPVKYAIILQVYNPYPGSATLTLNSPNGPVYTVPAASNLPVTGWNTITAYLDDYAGSSVTFCITGGTITNDETNETCTFETNLCIQKPDCKNLCTERPTCECLGRDISPSIRCSQVRPIAGYLYAYDFSVQFDWACRSIAIPTVLSTCGVFGTITPNYISGGTNVVSGVFYTNQPSGSICNFIVILLDDNGKEICRFCVRLRLDCRFGFAEENIFTKGTAAGSIKGSNASATTSVNKITGQKQASKNISTIPLLPVLPKDLTIVPNPASSIAHVNYIFNNEGNNSIVIYNLLGTPVKTFSNLPKAGVLHVDISTLPGGTYFVKGIGKDKILVAKLEVVR
jgi:PKD repeat protein